MQALCLLQTIHSRQNPSFGLSVQQYLHQLPTVRGAIVGVLTQTLDLEKTHVGCLLSCLLDVASLLAPDLWGRSNSSSICICISVLSTLHPSPQQHVAPAHGSLLAYGLALPRHHFSPHRWNHAYASCLARSFSFFIHNIAHSSEHPDYKHNATQTRCRGAGCCCHSEILCVTKGEGG